jgi:hypothetical protein
MLLVAARGRASRSVAGSRNGFPKASLRSSARSCFFLLPGDRREGRPASGRALSWREARIDWDIVLLYGGGMALGELCFSTGLAAALGQSINGWIPAGPWAAPCSWLWRRGGRRDQRIHEQHGQRKRWSCRS